MTNAFTAVRKKGMMQTKPWSLYIIEASDATLYTGITTDINRRFDEHRNGTRGAKYFSGRRPLKIVYREDGHSRGSAARREAEIKNLTRCEKQQLIAHRRQTLPS